MNLDCGPGVYASDIVFSNTRNDNLIEVFNRVTSHWDSIYPGNTVAAQKYVSHSPIGMAHAKFRVRAITVANRQQRNRNYNYRYNRQYTDPSHSIQVRSKLKVRSNIQ